MFIHFVCMKLCMQICCVNCQFYFLVLVVTTFVFIFQLLRAAVIAFIHTYIHTNKFM